MLPPASETSSASAKAVVERGVRLTETAKPTARNAGRAVATGALCLLCLFVATGCSVTRGTRQPDGTLVVTNYRLLWKSEAVSFTTNSTNFNARLTLGKSTSDDAAVGAVVEGVTTGIMKGALP